MSPSFGRRSPRTRATFACEFAAATATSSSQFLSRKFRPADITQSPGIEPGLFFSADSSRAARSRRAHSSFSFPGVLLDVRHCLVHDTLHELTAAFDFSHQHRALNHRDAKVRETLFGHIGIESAGSFLSDEERRDLGFHDFENETQILT